MGWPRSTCRRLENSLAKLPGIVPVFSVAWGGRSGIFARPLNRFTARCFRAFNVGFDFSTKVYTQLVGTSLRVSVLVLLVYGGLLYLTYWGFMKTPTGFIPMQDKGYLLVNIQLPTRPRSSGPSGSCAASSRWPARPTASSTVAIAGQSILLGANAPNFGAMYVMLDDFHERAVRGLTGEVIAATLQSRIQEEISDGVVGVFGAPPVDGLGTAGGFKIILEDRSEVGMKSLQAAAERVVDRCRHEVHGLTALFSSFRA